MQASYGHIGIDRLGPRSGTFWALKDVSFSVQPGDIVGIVGKNGAGKSALLRILSKITAPTAGRAILRGKTSSLLEVGTGFHLELTGIENVYLNGAILGMKRTEIRKKLDEIIAFAEVESFIETPVKFYSSGMLVRLAFSVAAHLEPEILILDEVLAVGDLGFHSKCLKKIADVSKTGRTVLIVSHNLQALMELASRTLWLEQGKIKAEGGTLEVLQNYRLSGGGATSPEDTNEGRGAQKIKKKPVIRGAEKVRVEKVVLKNIKGENAFSFSPSEPIRLEFQFVSSLESGEFEIGYTVLTPEGIYLFTSSSSDEGRFYEIGKGRYMISTLLSPNYLKPGTYRLQVGITCGELQDLVQEAMQFEIAASASLSKTPLGRLPGSLQFQFPWETPRKIQEAPGHS